MTSIAFFSTDFTREPIVDEMASALTGKTQYVPDKKRISHGGTMLQRGSMPAFELNKHGYDCHVSWQFRVVSDGHIETLDTNGDWNSPDVFWQQRWMAKGADDVFGRARSTGQIVLGDLDDQFWHLPKSNIAYDTTDPKNNPEFNRDHYRKNLGAGTAIILSTEALRKEVEPLGVPTYVVRNAIELANWPILDPTADGAVSWVGGLQWRAHDLQVLKPAVKDFLSDFPGIAFYHGGDSQVPTVPKVWDVLGLDKSKTPILAAPLCPIWEYPKLWEPVNIALVPLESCTFNQGKSYLKALEACASGVPYIVSKGFPEHQLLIDEGSAGRLADNRKPMSWYSHLVDLLDPDVRADEGKINRTIAEKHDIKDRWVDWADVLADLGVKPEVTSVAA